MKRKKKTVVLVGGCFDILHPGHVIFLEKAKRLADKLVVFLESDERVRMLKGPNRPVHTQQERVKVLSALRFVDWVISLPFIKDEAQYDRLVAKIKPNIIAVTKGYENVKYHKRAADLVGAKLRYVTKIVGKYSTSKILRHNGG